MKVHNKVIEIAGKYLNYLGEKERKNDPYTVCPIFGYQPLRPQKNEMQVADKK